MGWGGGLGVGVEVGEVGFRGQGFDMKGELNQKPSGNEVCYTNSLISLAKNMLCSKIHCQKVVIQFPFHIRFVPAPVVASASASV